MLSPADRTVRASRELARLPQLTEWPRKEGQPGKAQDSHCVCDELSSSVFLLAHPTCIQDTHTHTRTCAHSRVRACTHHEQAHKTGSWRKEHKGRIKEFLICFYLLAVKEFVIHSAGKTRSLAGTDKCICQFSGIV